MSWRHALLAIAHSAEELCGLLYGDELVAIRNVASNPCTAYAMDYAEQASVMATRGWPDAVWHTHPGGSRSPSNIDLATMPAGVRMIIVAPGGWIGTWLDGQQVMEAQMGSNTTNVGEVFQGTDGQWYWHVTAANGEKIAQGGEPFTSKQHATVAMYNAFPELKPESVTPTGGGTPDEMGAPSGGTGQGTGGGGGGNPAAGGTPTGPAGTGSSPSGPPATGGVVGPGV